jgi:uncharacterized protein with NAD-binding domain and iron-sulfur cluster
MVEPVRREKIVILGGGASAMTAAYYLSQPGWQERFESITVFQQGWRLGGKGASGRRGKEARIEEHGLHLWFGFYENAFRLMQASYAELNRPAGSPLRTWNDAFKKCSFVVLEELLDSGWKHWPIEYPEDRRVPGVADNQDESLTAWLYMMRALALAHRLTAHLYGGAASSRLAGISESPKGRLLSPLRRALRRVMAFFARTFRGIEVDSLIAALELAESMDSDAFRHQEHERSGLLGHIETFQRRLHGDLEKRIVRDDSARRLLYLIELLLAIVRGSVKDGLLTHKAGFSAIDDQELTTWLKLHGASEEAATCAFVRSLYDAVFAYSGGDPARPSIAAGQAIRVALRMFMGYKGALMWKMQAGMGDVVFAPLYEVLKRRGVQFRFFHRVTSLHLDGDRRLIDAIDVLQQAELKDRAREYQPLFDVDGLPCWPSEPLADQLSDRDRENLLAGFERDGQRYAYDLESFWTRWPDGRNVVLKRGQDFDRIVFGISLGSVPYVCAELVKSNPKWGLMTDKVETIQTQAFQLWLLENAAGLGWTLPQVNLCGYVEPFDTWADMRQLLVREHWPPELNVKAIAYFCNAMPTPPGLPPTDDLDRPQRETDVAKANALAFLRQHVGTLWPRAIDTQTGEFRWDLLADPANRKGQARFDSQFWRANVDPSERYVLSVPGSNQYRLKPNDTGFDNLYICGDWVDSGLNFGCVEAAVMSGMEASNAIWETPKLSEISGYGHP